MNQEFKSTNMYNMKGLEHSTAGWIECGGVLGAQSPSMNTNLRCRDAPHLSWCGDDNYLHEKQFNIWKNIGKTCSSKTMVIKSSDNSLLAREVSHWNFLIFWDLNRREFSLHQLQLSKYPCKRDFRETQCDQNSQEEMSVNNYSKLCGFVHIKMWRKLKEC